MHLSRRFFTRLTLGVLGTLVFIASPFIGVGWVLASHQEWLYKTLGDRRTRALWQWYLSAASELLPGDQDDDGWRDGVELMQRRNLRSARSREFPYVILVEGSPYVCLRGKRTPLRWMIYTRSGYQVPFPQGFQMTVWTETPVLLAKGETGPPTCGPILATANAQGELEFDFVAPVDAPIWAEIYESGPVIQFLGAVNGVPFGNARFPPSGWRHLPQEVSFTDERGTPLPQPPDPRTRLQAKRVFIARPKTEAKGYLVEARRRLPGASWERKAWVDTSHIDLPPAMDLGGPAVWQPQDRLEDFEFRVVPILWTKTLD